MIDDSIAADNPLPPCTALAMTARGNPLFAIQLERQRFRRLPAVAAGSWPNSGCSCRR